MVRQVLLSRGIEVSAGFRADASAFAGLPEAAIVAAALACDSERDFNARLWPTSAKVDLRTHGWSMQNPFTLNAYSARVP